MVLLREDREGATGGEQPLKWEENTVSTVVAPFQEALRGKAPDCGRGSTGHLPTHQPATGDQAAFSLDAGPTMPRAPGGTYISTVVPRISSFPVTHQNTPGQ